MINKIYLDNNVISQMKEAFLSQGVLKLNEFLDHESYLKLSQKLWSAGSKYEEIPDRYSYYSIDIKNLEGLHNNEEFLVLLSKITGKSVRKVDIKIRKFGHGNYTLLHDEEHSRNKGAKGVEFFLMISGRWDVKWGGVKVYASGEGEALVFAPEGGTFCLINSRGRESFVKYINHHAGKETFILVEGKIV